VAFAQNPAFAWWSAQNQLPSPHVLHYLIAYSLLIIPAIWGGRWAWKQASERHLLLIAWVLIVPILVYVPLNVQRRTSEAVIVPLAILAAAGLAQWRSTRQGKQLARGVIALACISTIFITLGAILAGLGGTRPLFRPTAEIAAFNWLNAQVSDPAVVLSGVQTGNVLPAYTHLRPYMGHGPETLDWIRKTGEIDRFFTGQMREDERAALYAGSCIADTSLCSDPITYLIVGDIERLRMADRGSLPINWQDEWSLIYDQDGWQIYRIQTLP
jgi:hypothetical protein